MKLFDYFRYIQSDIFSFPVIGVDISDASIHFVKARRQFARPPLIEFFGNEPIPQGIVELGEIKKEQELSKIIERSLARVQKGKTHYIVGALPEEKAFIKAIQVPHIDNKEELKNAIRFEAESSIPLSALEMYFDYEDRTPDMKIFDHRDIAVVAYPKEVVDSYMRVFRNADTRVVALELESHGIIRALSDSTERQKALLYVDVGRTKSGFIIYADQSLVFASTVPIGGRDFEKSIRDALSIDLAEAEKIKKKIGLSEKEMGGVVFRALEPLVAIILDELEKNINFFERHPRHTHEKENSVQKIVLCGGDAYLFGLMEAIAERTKLHVELGRSLRFFSNESEHPLLEHDSLSFTTALGLALRGIKSA